MKRVLWLALATAAVVSSSYALIPILLPAQLVVDLNSEPVPVGSDVSMLCDASGQGYFTAETAPQDRELWHTDGTSAGSIRLTNIPEEPSIVCLDRAPNGTQYFSIATASKGTELWISDGTPAGTHLVVDLNPLTADGFSQSLGFVGNRLVFVGDNGVTGDEVWITDGTAAGTLLLKDINPGSISTFFKGVMNSGATVYFGADTPGLGTELWVTDGTPAGTRMVRDINPGSVGSIGFAPSFSRVSPSLMLFVAETVDEGAELWRTDGTSGGTQMIADIYPGPMGAFVDNTLTKIGNRVVFAAADDNDDPKLWSSDGTIGIGNILRLSGATGDMVPATYFGSSMTVGGDLGQTLGTRVVFYGRTAAQGLELWSTDGTPGGTVLLTDISSATTDALFDVPYSNQKGNILIFSAVTAASGTEPWVTDGTQSGTRMLELTPGISSSYVQDVRVNGSQAFIVSISEDDPSTSSPTNTLSRYNMGDSAPMTVLRLPTDRIQISDFVDNKLLFGLDHFQYGLEPWVSDGTASGTRILRDISAQTQTKDSYPVPFAVIGNTALLTAVGTDRQFSGVWRTDGTAQGTTMFDADLQLLSPVEFSPSVGVGRIVFTAFKLDPVNNLREDGLWVTDGTSAGTTNIASLHSAVTRSNDGECLGKAAVTVNGVAYFGARTGDGSGTELWRSNGTVDGTRRIADIMPGIEGSLPCHFAVMQNIGYFAATVSGDTELWRTDGTTIGTQRVLDVRTNGSSNPADLVVKNNILYFVATGDNGAREVWTSDGTASGTRALTNLASSGSTSARPVRMLLVDTAVQYFTTCSANALCRLWRTDGTSAGTSKIADVVAVGSFGSRVVGNLKGNLLFPAPGPGPLTSDALWISDGTPAGTKIVSMINQPIIGAAIDFTDANGISYFRAPTFNQGMQLWRTDGTEEGTVMVSPILVSTYNVMAGPFPDAYSMVVAGQRVLFPGNDGVTGWELWMHENKAPFASADSATTTTGVAVDINVVTNDSDADGAINPVAVRIVSQPATGVVQVDAATGIVRYTSNATFSGADQFTYVVADNQRRESNPAMVSVNVNAGPTPPTTPTPNPTTAGGSSKGGGATSEMILLAMSLLLLIRLSRSRLSVQRSGGLRKLVFQSATNPKRHSVAHSNASSVHRPAHGESSWIES